MQRGTTEDNRHAGRRRNDEIKQTNSEQETKILLKTTLYIQPFKMRKSPVVFKIGWKTFYNTTYSYSTVHVKFRINLIDSSPAPSFRPSSTTLCFIPSLLPENTSYSHLWTEPGVSAGAAPRPPWAFGSLFLAQFFPFSTFSDYFTFDF